MELATLAPLSEQDVRRFMAEQEGKHEPNGAWRLEQKIWGNLHWFFLYAGLLAFVGWKFGADLLPTNGLGRSVDGIVAMFLFAILPLALVLAVLSYLVKGPVWWWPSRDLVLLAKNERAGTLKLPSACPAWLEGHVLRPKYGPDKDLAGVLWLVTHDEFGGKIRRGVRTWTETELAQALNPAST